MRVNTPAARVLSRFCRHMVLALLWLDATALVARAHGGMAGPDELGPPLFTSVALAFVCYWAVILWPSYKSRNPDTPSRKTKIGRSRKARKPARKATIPRQTGSLRQAGGDS